MDSQITIHRITNTVEHEVRIPIEVSVIIDNETGNNTDVINERHNRNIINTEEPHQMNQVIIISDNFDDKVTSNITTIDLKEYTGNGGTYEDTERLR